MTKIICLLIDALLAETIRTRDAQIAAWYERERQWDDYLAGISL